MIRSVVAALAGFVVGAIATRWAVARALAPLRDQVNTALDAANRAVLEAKHKEVELLLLEKKWREQERKGGGS